MAPALQDFPAQRSIPGGGPASRRVALLIESSNAYGRGLLAGIYDHKTASERWITFLPEHGRGAPPLASLPGWHGDGIVARLENEQIAAVVSRLGLPTIDTSAARLIPDIPYVETDDAAIARLAAAHLCEVGLRHFAFCGDRRFKWSDNRLYHFEQEMAVRGHTVDVCLLPATGRRRGGDDEADRIGRWVESLPKPVGVFACYDALGRRLIDVCHARSIAVPDQVAVLGVDDDELLCRLTTPPLSSVIPDARGAGRLAAELLDRMLDGQHVAVEHLLKPRGVAIRRSTDVLSVDDPLVAEAARFIRAHVPQGIKVEDVTTAMQVSRRVLEQRFLRALGRTPHDEILRIQFRMVEDLLRNSDLKLATIAVRCGFKHPEYMTAAFTKRYGVSPKEWRRINHL
jgi:LacI family transcriptional regulator